MAGWLMDFVPDGLLASRVPGLVAWRFSGLTWLTGGSWCVANWLKRVYWDLVMSKDGLVAWFTGVRSSSAGLLA